MLNGIFFLFESAWKGVKSLYLPSNTVSPINLQNEVDRLKKELQQLKAENHRLKTADHDYQKSLHEQVQEISELKALIASYKSRLEESGSQVALNKRRQEECELLVSTYQRRLEEHAPFFDLVEKNLTRLKKESNLDYTRTFDYIVTSAVRNIKILTFRLNDVTLQNGDKIYVCGGHELLGNWDPSAGLELAAVDSHYEASVGVNELAQSELNCLRYKYALWHDNAWYWESGENRYRGNPITSAIVDTPLRDWEVNPFTSDTK